MTRVSRDLFLSFVRPTASSNVASPCRRVLVSESVATRLRARQERSSVTCTHLHSYVYVYVTLSYVYVEARRHYLISWRCVTRMRDESNKSDRTSPRACSRGLTEAHVHADLLMQFVIEISTVAMDPLRELRLSPIYVWIRIGSDIYSARETATNLRGIFLEYVIDFNRSCGRLRYGCFSSE